MSALFRLAEVRAQRGGAEAVVIVDADAVRTSQVPGLADRMLYALPGLASHECENGAGRGFEQEAADTEIAHLLEHVALELMRRSGHSRPRGGTRWDSGADGPGVFRVKLEHPDGPACEAALREAAGVLATASEREALLLADAAIGRLRAA